jgi:osmotically-inducible protein OsmY
MITDEKLAALIERAILEDGRLSQQPIEVIAKDRIATLKGTVQSYRRKLVAHEIAASFEACRDVVNEIRVEPARVIPDEEVARHVRAALHAHADITGEVVAVSVSNGTVTLMGNVAGEWERTLAEDVALAAIGVRSVRNLLVFDHAREIEDEALLLRHRLCEHKMNHVTLMRN